MARVIETAGQLDFTIDDIPRMPLPKNVMMVRPTHYSVDYIINPHMTDHLGKVDKIEAKNEWSVIRDTFKQLEIDVHELEGREGLPDMVFCANQSLPYLDAEEKKHVVMSIMHADERKGEVPYIEQWYRQNGYEIHHLNSDKVNDFEGCGDAIWHTGRRLLWGGYGYRSSLTAYEIISDVFDLPVITLELVDESFYHLDTCLCILNENTALIYPDAFSDTGLEIIDTFFDRVIHASHFEAEKRLACNASCPDGKSVIIQKGCTDVSKKLRDEGFEVHEVDTKEYLKSGGSVFCMKQMVW